MTKASEDHSISLRQRVHEFKRQQADIDRRLLVITQSETSDDAVVKFDADMGVLRRLEVAQGYLELLTEVDNLRSDWLLLLL